MPTAHDHYSQQFQKWEVRGRGWQVFPEPVSPEPPFVPFGYRKMTETLAPDDGRKPTLLSSLMRKVANTVAPTRHAHGDWGDEPEKVRQGNEFALSHGGLFLSVYHDRNGVKFWIMTDTHRKTTTMLLPEDY